MTQEHDCPNCRHHLPSTCGAPKYREMTADEQKEFWSKEALEKNCALWEPTIGDPTP